MSPSSLLQKRKEKKKVFHHQSECWQEIENGDRGSLYLYWGTSNPAVTFPFPSGISPVAVTCAPGISTFSCSCWVWTFCSGIVQQTFKKQLRSCDGKVKSSKNSRVLLSSCLDSSVTLNRLSQVWANILISLQSVPRDTFPSTHQKCLESGQGWVRL